MPDLLRQMVKVPYRHVLSQVALELDEALPYLDKLINALVCDSIRGDQLFHESLVIRHCVLHWFGTQVVLIINYCKVSFDQVMQLVPLSYQIPLDGILHAIDDLAPVNLLLEICLDQASDLFNSLIFVVIVNRTKQGIQIHTKLLGLSLTILLAEALAGHDLEVVGVE